MEWVTGLYWFDLAGVPWEWLLTGFFCAVVLVQLFYFWFYYSRVAFFKKTTEDETDAPIPVSIIISARNEYPALHENLPLILNQDHPDFEVVVVNERSTDDSEMLLKELQKQYDNLKVVDLRYSVSFLKGKKLPISVGIKSASHDHLILTDAGCRPAGDQWIQNMTRHLRGDKTIVLGYSSYEQQAGIMNKIIRLDNLYDGLQYLGFALAGRPYKGDGGNLSYSRSLFYAVKGFTAHYKIPAGDDDLFVNHAATNKNTAVEFSPEAHTVASPPDTFSGWLKQKRQRSITYRYYKEKDKRRISLFRVSGLLFYPLFIVALVLAGLSIPGYVVAGSFLLRMISLFTIINSAAKTLKEPKISLFSLAGDVMLSVVYMMLFVTSVFTKKTTWK